MKTAVVIGAGVAGPVVAMALQKAGIHAEVFEAHPTGADEVGSWLTLQANGIDALRAVDARQLVAELGYPTRSMRFLNGKGKVLGRMSNGPVLPDGTGSPMLAAATCTRVCATRRWPAGRRSATGCGSSKRGPKGDGWR